jgi:hypothetical protein
MRAALAFGACLALAACGAGGSAGKLTGAGGNSATGAAGSTSDAGSTPPPQCQVDILPVIPTSFDGLTAGPMATVRVLGSITGAAQPQFGWQWKVSLADGSSVPVATVGVNQSLVEFPTASVGTYTIAVELTGTTCAGLRTITVARPGASVTTFRFHVTPPSTAAVPTQDLERQVTGGTPSGGNTLALEPGFKLLFDVTRAGDGSALPSYVRLTEASSGAVLETRTSAVGPVTLLVAQGMYGMLIVPDGDVAPFTVAAREAVAIGASVLALDDGPAVGGTVTDSGGKPIAGATVVLRSGDLLSTTGKTDQAGAFHLHARAGTFGLTVVTPLAAGGLEAKLAPEGGLVVDATAPTPPLAIQLQTSALVTGTVALSSPSKDPTSLGAEARVSVAAATPLANVATLTVGTGAPRALAGDVHFSLHPAADGTVSTGDVPPGKYALTVFPASATSSDGVTKATLDLTQGNVAALPVSLAQKVMLTGKLLPAAASSGVLIVAQDQGGLPVAAQGDAGPDGSFALAVSPFLPYLLRALPRADQTLARASFPVVTVTDKAPPGLDYDMPPALLFAGRVVDPSLQGVSTALVQAYCIASAPGCADATVPVAETITRSDGTFQLMLPDPDGTP